MAISTLLKIDGVTVPNVKEYTVERAKLWSNANRTLSGELKADFIGLFPKIKVKFSVMDSDDMAILTDMLDTAFFTLTWYDALSESLKSAQYYAGDYDTPLIDKSRELYNEFWVSLIPVAKDS